MSKLIKLVYLIIFLVGLSVFSFYSTRQQASQPQNKNIPTKTISEDPLAVTVMRQKDYPGSDLVIEQTLPDNANYHQYIASYRSENLKIYGLLTVPIGEQPKSGWPAIIFNHGYIPPDIYKTTERYVNYVDVFARSGYIVFKPDYRGNGNSEGQPEGAYYSPAYSEDVLNAISSLKKFKDVNSNKIGMWGHSLGGNITLRVLVVRPDDIKAAVIWGGVVGTYDDLMNNWQRKAVHSPSPSELALRNRRRQQLISKHGTPTDNPQFWNLVDPNFYLNDIKAPIQLHTGLEDEEVPAAFSQGFFDRLKNQDKVVEFYSYPDGDHNISEPNFSLAMQRSVDFFNKYLKNQN